MTPEDADNFLKQPVQDLTDEGINVVSYWVARMGLQDDDFRNWCFQKIEELVLILRKQHHGQGNPADQAAMLAFQCYVWGFMAGFVYAKQGDL